ncbi:MAG: TraC family protein [Bdellovibrionaceae bacterium]|nr:TraC family protein [Pseudobdellovibrionaceae bacterium]
MSHEAALCEQLPFWEFEQDPIPHAILSDGSLSTGTELLPLDIECFDESRINQLTFGLRAFANSLPEGATAQFLVKVESDVEEVLREHCGLVSTEIEFLRQLDQKRSERLLDQVHSETIFRPRLFFFLRTSGAEKPKSFSFSQTKKFSAEFEKNYDDQLQTLGQALEGASGILSSLGFTVSRCDREDLIQLLYSYFNPKRSGEITKPKVSPRPVDLDDISPRSQIIFGDLILDREDFVLDQLRTRVLSLKTLPEITFGGMMSSFLALPFKYELIFSFRIQDQAKEMKALESKRRMAHSLSSTASNRVSDLESESRLSQTTDLIRELIETGQRIYQAETILILREAATPEGEKKLNLRTKEVLSRFKTLSGSEGIQETVGAWKIFRSDLPLAPVNLVRAKAMKTNNLVDFLPLYGAATGDEKPVCLTKTRLGTLYSYDPYSSRLSNYNILTTGSSGSGKSFANNFLMLQQIARGSRLYVIDIGGSYKKMTEVLGGQYFEINLSGKYVINPFELSDPSVPPSGDRLKGFVSIIEQMVVDQGEKLSRFDRVQLEAALTTVFERARSEGTPRSPYLTDLAKHCLNDTEESLRRIGKLLFPWVGKTPYGKLLDGNGKIAVDKSVVAFDLKGLSQYPDLQSVMILILTNFILEQVETDRTAPKRVLLDEAWELLKSPAASSFMEYAARTFRKTGSGITFITQGVEEIIASGMGPAILNNTATKLVMLQKGDTNVLKEALKLNSQELRLIQSLEQRKGQFSEGFLMEGESRQVIRIEPSPLEYWISTSDARDNQFLNQLRNEGHSLESALIKAAELAPFGVSMMKVAAA